MVDSTDKQDGRARDAALEVLKERRTFRLFVYSPHTGFGRFIPADSNFTATLRKLNGGAYPKRDGEEHQLADGRRVQIFFGQERMPMSRFPLV